MDCVRIEISFLGSWSSNSTSRKRWEMIAPKPNSLLIQIYTSVPSLWVPGGFLPISGRLWKVRPVGGGGWRRCWPVSYSTERNWRPFFADRWRSCQLFYTKNSGMGMHDFPPWCCTELDHKKSELPRLLKKTPLRRTGRIIPQVAAVCPGRRGLEGHEVLEQGLGRLRAAHQHPFGASAPSVPRGRRQRDSLAAGGFRGPEERQKDKNMGSGKKVIYLWGNNKPLKRWWILWRFLLSFS